MPIDPVKIPQNVYIEDRIVGPLTLRQILIVGAGCGFSYALWSMMTNAQGGSIGIPLTVMVWIPGALSGLFAFFKINDLSLFRLCLLTLERMSKVPVRTWTPRRGITVNIRTFTTNATASKTQAAVDKKQAMHIDAISTSLDTAMDAAPGEMDAAEPLAPVDPSRVSAEPLDSAQAVDGVAPRAAVSLMNPSPAR